MKVDMSPGAVKARLMTLNELWLLSVKLMNSKKLKSAKSIRESAVEISDQSDERKSPK